MLAKIVISGWRATVRDPLYVAINLTGLAFGFAAAILIALFLRYETSFENFVPDADRLARLTIALHIPGRSTLAIPAVASTVARDLVADMPGIEQAVRATPETYGVRRGTFEASEKVLVVDPGFLALFGLKLAHGDVAGALDRPDGVVLSQDAARKYFGTQNPLGETLEIGRGHVMQVTGVLAPVPSNSHLQLDIVISGRAGFSLLARRDAEPEPALFNFLTYVKLKPGTSVAAIRAALPDFLKRHPALPADQTDLIKPALDIQPLLDIHLHSFPLGELKPGTDPKTLWAFAAIGVLVLAVASINFITLLSARASRRALEVGVRKAVGAARMHLILQFLSETLIQAFAAMVLAVALVELALPSVSGFLGRTLDFSYWDDPLLGAALVTMVLAVGLVAGSYPALLMSAFRPGQVLKGEIPGGNRRRLRQGLVVVQFAISIGLIIATMIIGDQTDFARRRSLKLDQDPILLIGNLGQPFPRETIMALRGRIAALPGVRAVAIAKRGADRLLDQLCDRGDARPSPGRDGQHRDGPGRARLLRRLWPTPDGRPRALPGQSDGQWRGGTDRADAGGGAGLGLRITPSGDRPEHSDRRAAEQQAADHRRRRAGLPDQIGPRRHRAAGLLTEIGRASCRERV